MAHEENQIEERTTLSHFARRPPVDIEFQDLTYTVPQGRKGNKIILRSISGKFRSGQLTAILGPSGAGKSTLLNILAGYKCSGTTGSVLVNGEHRDLKEFRNISRYIMQEDLIQPLLSVEEVMMMAADLKLSKGTSICNKQEAVLDVLNLLRLSHTLKTSTQRLSGGERKRLSIALELLNNPPVIFLDEPTTGLDDLSCSQCVMLLKKLAEGGRTVICSVHTPSARLFQIFDYTYIISNGQCAYQGYGPDVVKFLQSSINFDCPKHYNPADFIIEVCCGEYGDFQDRIVSAIDNGRNNYSNGQIISIFEHDIEAKTKTMEYFEIHNRDKKISSWEQFKILLSRMMLQMWRDKNYLIMKVVLHLFVGIIIGNLYIGFGEDGSKTIFNFGFYFICIIFFMYVPMMPCLLSFPTEVQYLKREHFNKWYSLRPYFCALTVAAIPIQIVLGCAYLTMVYLLSDQPLVWDRMFGFYAICMLTSFISESFGLMISTTLNIVNSMFIGPVCTVPLMLLAVYGFGEGYAKIPILIKVAMHFSYLRYSMEGLTLTMLKNRPDLQCPEDEEFCIFTSLDRFIEVMGMDNAILWVDITALFACLILIRGTSYYLLRQRLSPNKTFEAVHYVGRFIKSHFK